MKGGRAVFGIGCGCARGQISFEFIMAIIIILLVFVAGLSIFTSRQDMNLAYSQKWGAQNAAYKLARNINNAALLDGNAVISDSVVFAVSGLSVVAAGNVLTLSGNGFSAGVPIDVNSAIINITDLNGTVVFRKSGGVVTVGYN